ncbi:hypothetical protein [Streptomyces sp. YGL11-2]|uniref:hypothetical protein n=1 Tax=Streptomyces sp. YGL11-2 TaxID=3414028 RepID=UPI003CEF7CB6
MHKTPGRIKPMPWGSWLRRFGAGCRASPGRGKPDVPSQAPRSGSCLLPGRWGRREALGAPRLIGHVEVQWDLTLSRGRRQTLLVTARDRLKILDHGTDRHMSDQPIGIEATLTNAF